jgi:hypothetical protein
MDWTRERMSGRVRTKYRALTLLINCNSRERESKNVWIKFVIVICKLLIMSSINIINYRQSRERFVILCDVQTYFDFIILSRCSKMSIYVVACPAAVLMIQF